MGVAAGPYDEYPPSAQAATSNRLPRIIHRIACLKVAVFISVTTPKDYSRALDKLNLAILQELFDMKVSSGPQGVKPGANQIFLADG